MRTLRENGAVLALLMGVLPLLPSGAEAGPLADPLLNGGFETPSNDPADAFAWQDFHGGYERVGAGPHGGGWAIRLVNAGTDTLSGAYQRIDIQQTELKPVFVGGFVRGQNIQNSPNGYFGASLYAEIHLQDGSVAYWNSIGNFGSFGWRRIGFNTGTIANVNQPIDHIFIVPLLGYAQGSAWFDDLEVRELEPHQSAVTFMFDDGADNTYTLARPVLDSYGFGGSTAIIANRVGNSGFMTAAQIVELASSGWEVVSHGLSHSDLTQLSTSEALEELVESKAQLESLGLEVQNFAFPFGAYNGELLGMGAPSYTSMRLYWLGDNPEGVFPHAVKVRSVGQTTTPDQVQAWVEQAKTDNRWVILTFHAITSEGNSPFDTDPAVFSEIAERVAASGMDVVTYGEGISRFAFELKCTASPLTDCAEGWSKGSLLIDERSGGKEKLRIALRNGPALAQTDFGDPLQPGGTAFSVCIYDDTSTLVGELDIDRAGDQTCSGGTKECWKAIGSSPPDPRGKGYKYKDKVAAADGAGRILLKAGDAGRSSIRFKAANKNTKGQQAMPVGIVAALADSTAGATVQLIGHKAPTCTSLTLPTVVTASGGRFAAKGP